FADGTEMQVADAIYPFVFAYRWGAKAGAGDDAHEPRLEVTLDVMQERLAGFKVVRVEQTKQAIAEGWEIIRKTPVVEVFLRNVPHDEGRWRHWRRRGARSRGIS